MLTVVFFALLAAAVADKPHVYQPAKDLLQELKRYGQIGLGDGSSRIVAGSNTDISNHPWQISLRYNGNHICGGSIISANTILTAAHCVDFGRASDFSVLAGSSSHKTANAGQLRDVNSIIKHSGYNPNSGGYPNDIAVLHLTGEFYFGDTVKAISLPSNSFNPSSAHNCYMTGWGRTNKGTTLPDQLQEAQVDPISNSYCQSMMTGISGATIYQHHICPHNGVSSSCSGDSGGPYVCQNGNEYVLTGVTSWGIQSNDKCLLSYPSVYVRVSEFLNWINANLQ